MTLVKFTNGQKNGVLKSPYTDIFGSLFNPEPYLSKSLVARVPAVNVAETENEFHIELAVPGLKKDDFKINVEKDQLSVSADQKDAEADTADKKNTTEKSSITHLLQDHSHCLNLLIRQIFRQNILMESYSSLSGKKKKLRSR